MIDKIHTVIFSGYGRNNDEATHRQNSQARSVPEFLPQI